MPGMLKTIRRHESPRGHMKILTSTKVRRAVLCMGAAGAGAFLVFLVNVVLPGTLGPVLGAFLAALVSVPLFLVVAKGKQADESGKFIELVGHSIDDIMIGAAETSYFVDW